MSNETKTTQEQLIESGINFANPTVEDQIHFESFFSELTKTNIQESVEASFKKGRAIENKDVNNNLNKAFVEAVKTGKDELETAKTKRGAKAEYRETLEEIGVEKVTLDVLVHVVNEFYKTCEPVKYNAMLIDCGKDIESEYYGVQCEKLFPEEYNKMMARFRRNHTKSVSHRRACIRSLLDEETVKISKEDQMRMASEVISWFSNVVTEPVKEESELPETDKFCTVFNMYTEESEYPVRFIKINDKYVQSITPSEINSCVMPTIVEPMAWTNIFNGGFYGDMKNDLTSTMIKSSSKQLRRREEMGTDDAMTIAAVNNIQKQAWEINPAVLEFVKACIEQGVHFKEIETKRSFLANTEEPKKFAFFDKIDKSQMTPAQLKKFLAYKAQKCKLETVKRDVNRAEVALHTKINTYDIMSMVNKFYFVYTVDYRGRIYSNGGVMNPQGSDLDKYIMRAHEGAKLRQGLDSEGNVFPDVYEFKAAATAKYGFDKVSLRDRVKWFDEHEQEIIATGEAPFENLEFLLKSDHVISFYAFCEEYARFVKDPENFVTKLPCPLDGTCSGLQHISAIMRDAEAGRMVNLCENGLDDAPNDIYKHAVAKVKEILEAIAGDDSKKRVVKEVKGEKIVTNEQKLAQTWLAREVFNRNLTKKTTMTLSYNCTFSSCVKNVKAFIEETQPAIASSKNGFKEIAFLAEVVWSALHGSEEYGIEGAVQRGLELLEYWKQICASTMKKQNSDNVDYKALTFKTPTGFRVVQVAQETKSVQVSTSLGRNAKVSFVKKTNKANVKSHVNKIVANGIHSLDASHLVMTCVNFTNKNDVFQSYIHDSFATLAPFVGKMRSSLQQSYVELYSEDQRNLVGNGSDFDIEAPELGDYDIEEVLDSVNFFS